MQKSQDNVEPLVLFDMDTVIEISLEGAVDKASSLVSLCMTHCESCVSIIQQVHSKIAGKTGVWTLLWRAKSSREPAGWEADLA
jgi:hypothetical protein